MQILDKSGTPEEAGPEITNFVEMLNIRIQNFSWNQFVDDETVFSLSPDVTLNWDRVVDEFKNRDNQIEINSVRFRWQEIRRETRCMLNAEQVVKDFSDEC